MKFYAFFSFLFLFKPFGALASTFEERLTIQVRSTSFQVGIFSPTSPPIADIFFVHGLGDKYTNHRSLFEYWNASGIRVISFDLPSHGGTTGRSINSWSISELARIVPEIETDVRSYLSDNNIPLYLAGYSIGGLVATRIVQLKKHHFFSGAIGGLILINPAIYSRLLLGEFGTITNQTLTHDQTLFEREILPRSIWDTFWFDFEILAAQSDARNDLIPTDLSVLLFLSDNDYYTVPSKILNWSKTQIIPAKREAGFNTFQCIGAMHELDNELLAYGSNFLREATVKYVLNNSSGKSFSAQALHLGPCVPR